MSAMLQDDTVPRIDYNSPDWHRIVEHLQSDLNDETNTLVAKGVDERTADFIRGRIHQIRMILDWSPHAGR